MIIVKTPLRVGLLGGGSDIPSYFTQDGRHGAVINFTIDKYVYVLVKKRYDDYIYLKYSENEVVHKDDINTLKHDFIRETLKFLNIDFGIEIINWADIPTKGTGLGSSSSFLVGLLHALYTLKGENVSEFRLARDACHIEVDMCKKPIGYQDQIAAAHGGLQHLAFHGTNKQSWSYDTMSLPYRSNGKNLSDNILMFYTGITRESQEILSEQSEDMKSDEEIIANMDRNVELADQGIQCFLHGGDMKDIGRLLNENWKLKKSFNKNMSNERIDKIYSECMRMGATGGKITGAGGGGFFVVHICPEMQPSLRKHMRTSFPNIKEMTFEIEPYGSRVLLNLEGDRVW